MRDSNIGNELKEMAQEVVRFGERCVQAGRDWLNERRDEMNNRNDGDRRDFQAGREYGHDGNTTRGQTRQGRGQYGTADHERSRLQSSSQGSRGEYYGGGQFGERMQSAGWEEDRGNWDYEGGPERYGTSGYGEREYGDAGIGRQYGAQQQGSQYGSQYGQREQGSHAGTGDYYRGRQGYGAQSGFGSEYNTYGRHQGYGEGSGYTRAQSRGVGSQRGQGYAGGSRYGGESAGLGGRGSLYGGSQSYLDEGEMSGYGGRELGTQQYGSSSSGRYGTAPGQYGYGGYGGSFRGVGPKNYRRSDERLAEDINERLTDDDLDASNITVSVTDGKVSLEGTVDQRWMKHRAEDIADSCIGVKEVDNRIHVASGSDTLAQGSEVRGTTTSRGAQGQASPGTTTGGTTPH